MSRMYRVWIMTVLFGWLFFGHGAFAQSCQDICNAYFSAATSGYGSGYSAGNLADLYNQCMACQNSGGGGGYQEQPRSACNPGFYAYGRYCVPNGEFVCRGSDGQRSCPSHLKCMSGGGCIPTDADDCGNGRYCSDGKVCVPSGYLGGELEDRCFTPDQLAELRQAYEAQERHKAEERERERQEAIAERERKRQEAIAERKRKEEERREAKRRKEQEKREAAKARSEARHAEVEKRRKEEEAARAKASQQAIAQDRNAITSGISPSSQLGSAITADQIVQDLRANRVLDRMNSATTGNQAGPVITEQRRLIPRQTPAPTASPVVGNATGTATVPTVAPPPTMLQAPATAATTSPAKPATSWVQDFATTGTASPEKLPDAARRALDEQRRQEGAAPQLSPQDELGPFARPAGQVEQSSRSPIEDAVREAEKKNSGPFKYLHTDTQKDCKGTTAETGGLYQCGGQMKWCRMCERKQWCKHKVGRIHWSCTDWETIESTCKWDCI